VTGATADVTAEATGAGADMAEAAADVTAEATGAGADVTGATAEVAQVMSEVAQEVTEVTGAEVAACACRENTSRMVRIPAAKIATCTAR
jgi:hypothetical protein